MNAARTVLITAAVAVVWMTEAGIPRAAPAPPAAMPGAACDAPARSYAAMAGLFAGSAIATPPATTSGQTLPKGTPADARTVAAMETAIRTWLACQNAGEPLRAWSLFSEGYLYRLLSREGAMSGEAYAALATPSPAEEQAELLEIRDHRLLPDGRFGATVTIAYPSVPMPKQFFFYFTRVNDRLLIDGILGEISFSVP